MKGIIECRHHKNVALAVSQSDLDAMTKPFEADFQAGITMFVKDSLPKRRRRRFTLLE
ncbi:hypothetical protein OK016_17050 [Vibrio chagasii]|nr:hypothetical protein [Vibrio chagasii]